MKKLPNKDRKRTIALAEDTGSLRSHELANPFGRIIAECRNLGWNLLYLSVWNYEIPKDRSIDGAIIYLKEAKHHSAKLRIRDAVPNAISLSEVDSELGFVTVVTDPLWQGIEAARHFGERGFQHFALCTYERVFSAAHLCSFYANIRNSNNPDRTIATIVIDGKDHTEQAERFLQQLSLQPKPLALFCSNDRLAARVCQWCADGGLAVPEEIAILGFGDDANICETAPVPLSSFTMDYGLLGIRATELLRRMMDGEEAPPEPLRVPLGHVVPRRSTDILAIPDPVVSIAIRYIWDHYASDIGLTDIAEFCGVSRRTLTTAFRNRIGHSVVEEVTRHRLLSARDLLADTLTPAADIAALTGFMSPQYFSNRFKDAFGVTPLTYRRTIQKNHGADNIG